MLTAAGSRAVSIIRGGILGSETVGIVVRERHAEYSAIHQQLSKVGN
jgi:hypothetical protein